MTTQRSMPLKEKFNVSHSSSRNEAIRGNPRFGQKVEKARGTRRPEPSLGFLQGKQGRAGKQLRTDWFE